MKQLVCNKCGKITVLHDLSPLSMVEYNKHHRFNFQFGYGSKYDLLSGKMIICENCLLEWLDSFAVEVEPEAYEIG